MKVVENVWAGFLSLRHRHRPSVNTAMKSEIQI
jgi:hypothetical protein